jgi:outer membrane cobalamin receptor
VALTGALLPSLAVAGDSTPDDNKTSDVSGNVEDRNAGARGKPAFYDTATVEARPVDASPASVAILDAREVDASGSRGVGDAIREVPGLNVLATGGRAGVTNVWIRGGDPNFTLVLLDGVPLNDWTERQGGAVNFEELPARLVDHVEVIEGPLTSFYGPSGLAGVVQLFTPRGGPGPTRYDARAEAGSASLLKGSAAISGPVSTGGYSGGAAWERERRRVGDDSFRQLDLWAGADFRLGADADLALRARGASGDTSDYPDASGGPVYGDGMLRTSQHRDYSLSSELQLGPRDGPRHRVAFAFYRRDLDRDTPAVPPVVPSSVESTAFTRLRLAWQAPIHQTERTTVDVGVSGELEKADNASVLELPPSLGGELPGDYHESRASGGAYAEVRRALGRISLEGALRVDAASGQGLQLNPRLGIVWRSEDGATRLRLSGGRASKLPSFFATASPRALGGNPDLLPESTIGGEIGLNHSFGVAHLVLDAAVFLHEYRDVVDFDFQQFLNVNRARVRARGAEARLAWQPARSLETQAQATWLDASDPAGSELLQRPRWVAGGFLTWRPTDRLGFRVDGHGVSGYFDKQYPEPERDRVAGYALAGAGAWWRFRGRWTLRARLDNATNRAYETLIGFPGPRRSFWLGLGWGSP